MDGETIDRSWDGLDTGLIRVIYGEGPADCYVTVPIEGEPGVFLSVFQDGSFTRWSPSDAAPERIPPRMGGDTGRHRLV